MNTPLRIGFLGASRGMDFAAAAIGYPYATVAAICESYQPLCDKAQAYFREKGIEVECYTDFDAFLEQSGIDALVIANYANKHAPYAIRALEKGIHVLSEVLPVQTPAEGAALVNAVEKSGCIYAYSENYCCFDANFLMRRHYEAGDIGEAFCLEGTFINDCSFKWHLLTRGIRDHWRNYVPSTFYCTHSIGPMFYSTGRRAVRVNGLEIPRMDYMAEGGARSGSAGMEVMELDNGGMARSMNGNLRHPYEASYRLIGEHGSIVSDGSTLHVLAHQKDWVYDRNTPAVHYPEFVYRPENGDLGSIRNSDATMMGFFIGAILGDAECRKYIIDVYQALDMSLPGLFAYRSIVDHGMPYAVPDFRDPVVRAQYENDIRSTDPETPEEFRLPTSKTGTPDVDESVYEAVRARFAAVDLTPGMK